MRAVFGESFDQGAWPGPLADRHAAVGEAWVGPHGLVGLLEIALGLTAPRDVSEAERAASIVPALRACEGPWSRSLEHGADPIAVARAVLRLRDTLLLAGLPLTDEADPRLGPRLGAFLDVARHVGRGLPERLSAIESAVRVRPIDLERIELVDEVPWLALARVLEALKAAGVEVRRREVAAAPAHGDLAASRAGGFLPTGDGSLQLLRGDCVDETAAEVAAHLAALGLDGGAPHALIIAPDSALDAAFARLGLPTLGAPGEPGDDALLQVTPLLVALAWQERDPERALELLSLPASPVRRAVAARLARALARQPAVGSPSWQEALALALEALPESERAPAAARVEQVFGGATAADRMPLALFEQRLALARRWLFGRQERSPHPSLLVALAQVSHASRIARAYGGDSFSRLEVARLLSEATSCARPKGPRPALAGFATVGDAGAVCAPAPHVVWWGFSAASEQLPSPPLLSADERRALAAAGAVLEAPAAFAERRAGAWARPLLCAGQTLLLACARRDARGDEQHTHPLWDEIVARAGGDGPVAPLVRRSSTLAASLRRRSFRQRDLPSPRASWAAPAGSVPVPETETPSGREALLGCTFLAAMQRAGLRERLRSLPDGRRLFGELAHEVIAEVLRAHPTSGEAAEEAARASFDELVPRRAAALMRPEEKSQRLRAQETIAHAAGVLVDTLGERGMTVRAVEEEIVKQGEGRCVRGRPDVVVGDPLVVIDLKSGRERERRRALEDGVAVQLVAYAALLRAPREPWPELAYFQVRSAHLDSTSPELAGAQAIDPALTVEQSHQRLKRRAQRAEADLERGALSSPGVGSKTPRAPEPLDGEIAVAPPCATCAFGALCGRLLPGGTEGAWQ